MTSYENLRGSWIGPAIVGLAAASITGLAPANRPEELEPLAIWTLGLGLAGTYFSLCLLVGLLPAFPGWAQVRWKCAGFGLLVGVLYSVPSSVFVMVPYPLAEDAAPYYKEFAAGGWRAFWLTLLFGGGIGAVAGLFKKRAAS